MTSKITLMNTLFMFVFKAVQALAHLIRDTKPLSTWQSSVESARSGAELLFHVYTLVGPEMASAVPRSKL